jgi:hypothetical protein
LKADTGWDVTYASVELDHDLAVAVIIDLLEFANIT